MPGFLKTLTAVGTAAMLWVGGSILVHGLKELGFGQLEHLIHNAAVAVGHAIPQAMATFEWIAKATMDGIFGLAIGLLLIPVATGVIAPVWGRLFGKSGH